MKKVSNQQLIAGFETNDWVYTYGENGMAGLNKQSGKIVAASTLSEEMIGTMKSTRKQSNFTLFRRPKVCWNEVLKQKVIEI